MISISGATLRFSRRALFKNVNNNLLPLTVMDSSGSMVMRKSAFVKKCFACKIVRKNIYTVDL